MLTPYGAGEVVEVVDTALGMGLNPRHSIRLPWATLYSPTDDPNNISDTRRPSHLSPQQEWMSTARCAMTSMVVSLDVIHVISVVFHHFEDSLTPTEVVSFLNALETSHWHARSFNEDSRLSLELTERNFMQFPALAPRLTSLSRRSAPRVKFWRSRSICRPWGVQGCGHAVGKAIHRKCDRALLGAGLLLQGMNPIEKKLIDAYKPAVMTVLDGLKDCSEAQYKAFGEWMMPLITKLILCHDFEVRVRVSAVLPSLVKWSEQNK